MENFVLGEVVSTIGTLFIAYAALRVHHRVLEEHKIDKRVFRTMKAEQLVGIIGAVLVIIGMVLKLKGPLGV